MTPLSLALLKEVRMPTQTSNLFLLEDFEDAGRTRELAENDLAALRAVADWIQTFVAGLTRISAAMGPSAPSCLVPWNAGHFGSLLNRSPNGACQMLLSL